MHVKTAPPGLGQGRGLALGHLKHRLPESDAGPAAGSAQEREAARTAARGPAVQPETAVGPAVIVERGRREPTPVTYAAPIASPIVEVADGARIQTNIHVKERIAGEVIPGER